MLDRLFYAILCNLMQEDALNLAVEGLAQLVGDVESDRLAFAIRVGGEVDVVFALGQLLYFVDNFGFTWDDVVFGLEIMLDIDTEGALGQIDHVPNRGSHLVGSAEVALYGFRLGGRLYNDQIFC